MVKKTIRDRPLTIKLMNDQFSRIELEGWSPSRVFRRPMPESLTGFRRGGIVVVRTTTNLSRLRLYKLQSLLKAPP